MALSLEPCGVSQVAARFRRNRFEFDWSILMCLESFDFLIDSSLPECSSLLAVSISAGTLCESSDPSIFGISSVSCSACASTASKGHLICEYEFVILLPIYFEILDFSTQLFFFF